MCCVPLFLLDVLNDPAFRDSIIEHLPTIWAGHRVDLNTGLADMQARWRDTGTGVFLSEDPASYAAGDSNLYRYALNSPGNVVDPGETQGSHADSSGHEEPDSYSNFIYRAVGEQTRAVLGDRFLMANEYGAEIAFATGAVVAAVASVVLAPAELTFGGAILLGGAAGAIDYGATAAAAYAIDRSTFVGWQWDQLGNYTASGALTGGVLHVGGSAVGAAARAAYQRIRPTALASTLAAPKGTSPDRLFVHLRPDQYEAVVSSGYLGRGYQGASKVLLPPFDEGRIWATAYSGDQLRGVVGALRSLTEGINPLTVGARTKTIELTGAAAAAFTRPRGSGFSYNVFGWLKGTVGTQRQFRGQLRHLGSDTISSLDGSILYTAPQLRVFRAGELERLGIYGGTGLAVGWWLSNE